MSRQIRQYAPDEQGTSGGDVSNAETLSSTASGNQVTRNVGTNSPDEDNESGPIHDSDEDGSGVDRRDKNTGSLTGTANDETGPGENMATES